MFFLKKLLVKKLKNDLIAVEWWNKKTIESLGKKGIVRKYGIVPKGPKKGKTCICLTNGWEARFLELKKETTSRFRFWISVLLTLIGLLIALLEFLK